MITAYEAKWLKEKKHFPKVNIQINPELEKLIQTEIDKTIIENKDKFSIRINLTEEKETRNVLKTFGYCILATSRDSNNPKELEIIVSF